MEHSHPCTRAGQAIRGELTTGTVSGQQQGASSNVEAPNVPCLARIPPPKLCAKHKLPVILDA
eukprot:6193940-Pleurochrysis_carterae.AAC.1